MSKGMNKITPKQEVFAREYVKNGGNGTEAAKKAGYKSPAVQASENLRKPNVLKFIEKLQSDMDKANGRDVATLADIQAFRVRVMRGKEKDVFGRDAALTDRLKAANDLEKALKIKEEKEEKERKAEEARQAAVYHTDLDSIPDTFHPVIRKIRRKEVSEVVLKGGRGSSKSTTGTMLPFEVMKNNPNIHCLALRQVANTLRDSIYAQFEWSCDEQAKNPMFDRDNWDFKLSPLEITYKPTGQKIYFRGADDPGKIKSIKVPFGYIGIVVFEELDQFDGPEAVRKIEQSAVRGGDDVLILKMFNPPICKTNWANVYAATPNKRMLVHESSYLDVPPEWLGKAFIEQAEHLKETNPTAYEHEYLGHEVGIGIEIFPFLEIREITDEEIARQERIYQGQDWGWSPDPKAFIRLSYSHATETVMLLDEDGGTCIKVSEMARRIKEKGYADYEVICGADELEHIDDYRDAGLYARPADVRPGSVKRTFEWLQCRKIVIDPRRTPRAYKEFTEYSHDMDKNGDPIDGYPDHNNHWIDAVRYATSAISMRRGSSA